MSAADSSAPGAGVAVITGGASGIGAATAARLRGAGWTVWTFDMAQTADDSERHVVGDVRDADALTAFADRAAAAEGGLDALIACAGVKFRGGIDEVTPEVFADALAINLTGAFLSSRAVLPHLRARGAGSIVYIASGSAYGDVAAIAYGAAKAGVLSLAASASEALLPDRIRVNSVVPGFVDTPMAAATSEAGRAAVIERMVAGRLTTADDVAATIAYLCSPDAATITGGVFDVGHRHQEPIRRQPGGTR